MPRETAVTIRMSFEEKEALKAIAKTEGLSLSEFLRDVALRPVQAKEERAKALDRAKEAVEDDPSNLNAALDEKGSVVKQYEEIEAPESFKREAWVAQREKELGGRMSKRAAQIHTHMSSR